MTMEETDKLLKDLEESGYSLVRGTRTDPNDLLARVVKSEDGRVQEGFPVLLAGFLLNGDERLNLSRVSKLLPNEHLKQLLFLLTAYTLDFLQSYGEYDLYEKLTDHLKQHRLLNRVRTNLRDLNARRTHLLQERLRTTFFNYFMLGVREKRAREKQNLSEDLRQEHFLSLLFSPKQRDVLMKKVRGEKLNKTEREYFSRVVKKRLMAVTDPDVHRLAMKALQQ